MKAIVFDLDGTIIDTEKSLYESYRQAFLFYKYDLTLDVWGKWVGGVGTPKKACDYVAKQTGLDINEAKIQEIQREVFFQLIKNEKPLPGVINMLETGKQAGLHIGLATNSPSSWANYFLDTLNIRDYFDNVYTSDDVKQPKPAPEIYVRSVEYFKINPKEAIAFEDSVIGSLAAKRANLFTIAIPSTLTKEANFNHVDMQVPSMKNVNLDDLAEKLTFTKKPISIN